jgi:hypothetical protein
LEKINLDGMIILKCIIRKKDVNLWAGIICLRIDVFLTG